MNEPVRHTAECQIIGPFELDAAGYVPRPRAEVTQTPPPGLPGERTRVAKARWLPVIRQNTVPADRGRLRVGDGRGLVGDRITVCCDGGSAGWQGGPAGPASGQELSVGSEDHLILYVTSRAVEDGRESLSEEVTYIPWEAITRITFSRKQAATANP